MSKKKKNNINPNARSRVAEITSPVSAEVKRKRKKSMTVRDYGKQKGYMWAIILIVYTLIMVIAKFIFESQYKEPFPSDFNTLFLLFLPVAIGLAAFIIARIAAVAVRGILLILIVAAPWIYSVNMGIPPVSKIFSYTLHELHGEKLIPFFVALAFVFAGNFVYNTMRVYFPDRFGARFWSFLPLLMVFLFGNLMLLLDQFVYEVNFYFHVVRVFETFPLNLIVLIPAGIALLYFVDGLFSSKRSIYTRLLFWLTSFYILALVGYWGYQSVETIPIIMAEKAKEIGDLTGRIIFDTVMMFIYLFSLVGLFASGFADICINLLLALTKQKKKVKQH